MKKPGSPVVFIVDKNPVYQKITEQYLNIAGYTETLCVNSVAECIDYLDLSPDIIVSEYPGITDFVNGQAFLDLVKKNCPETLVIFLTSFDDLQSAVRSLASGAVDYILKSKSAHTKLICRLNAIYNYKREMWKNIEISKKLITSLCILVVIISSLVAIYTW